MQINSYRNVYLSLQADVQISRQTDIKPCHIWAGQKRIYGAFLYFQVISYDLCNARKTGKGNQACVGTSI